MNYIDIVKRKVEEARKSNEDLNFLNDVFLNDFFKLFQNPDKINNSVITEY